MASEENAVLPYSAPKLFSDDVAPDENKEVGEEDVNSEFILPATNSSVAAIHEFFELDRVLNWITANGFKRVALQLPDSSLEYAFEIAQFLEDRSSAKAYVLGDTSYRNCCVDEVAAEHASCDSLVHFGDACLSACSTRIPLLYIFCKFRLDLEDFAEQLRDAVKGDKMATDHVALLYDSALTNDSVRLAEMVSNSLPTSGNFCVCHVNDVEASTSEDVPPPSSFGRKVPDGVEKWEEGATLIFVGSAKSPLLPLWLMTFVNFSNVVHYSPHTKKMEMFSSSASRMLRKRLFLIEKLRDANTVGLVVGTLAVKGFREAIARVRELCKAAQKKLYVLSVGKLNEAKLSNFAGDIDVFILLSCPFGIVLNNEFYRPIVSLFEAEIALNPDKEWYSGSGWTAEFNQLTLKDSIGTLEEDASDVSLITGRMRFTKVEDEDEKDAAENRKKQVVQYTAGDYFANRSWKGLDDECLEDAETTVKVGLSGIAANYSTETTD